MSMKQQIISLKGKYQKKNKHKKSNILLFNELIISKNFDWSLPKVDKKLYKNIGIDNIRFITNKKIDDYKNIRSVNPLYLMIDKVIGHIKDNNRNKYLVFDSTDENKEVLKNTKSFGMGLKLKLRP